EPGPAGRGANEGRGAEDRGTDQDGRPAHAGPDRRGGGAAEGAKHRRVAPVGGAGGNAGAGGAAEDGRRLQHVSRAAAPGGVGDAARAGTERQRAAVPRLKGEAGNGWQGRVKDVTASGGIHSRRFSRSSPVRTIQTAAGKSFLLSHQT